MFRTFTALIAAALAFPPAHASPKQPPLRGDSPSQQSIAMPHPPTLPLVKRNVLPGEGWVLGDWSIGSTTILDTWREGRKPIAMLPAKTVVTLLEGLSIVYQPDVVTISERIPELGVIRREKVFRYTYYGEGEADFWAKGRWYAGFDGSFITEAEGSGCATQCKGKVTVNGRKIWWFRVRLSDGRTGWTNHLDLLDWAGKIKK